MPVAAAIVGSAVVGAGSSIYSASQQKKVANQANAAQQAAADKQLAAQQANFDRITGLNQPFVDAGASSLGALQRRLGLAGGAPTGNAAAANKPSGGSAGTSPLSAVGNPGPASAPAGGQPDYAAYFAQNPDLQAEYQRLEADPSSASMFNSPEEYAAYHAQTFHDRAVPTSAPTAQAPIDPAELAPQFDAAPTFERGAAMSAPSLSSYIDPSKFQVDPGYQFRLSEGLNAVNSASAARGLLRSGDAAKALQARGEGLANQGYNDWYNRQLAAFNAENAQYQYGQNRADNVFQNDRAYGAARWQDNRDYQTNRWDTQTGNLFNLAGIGQGAAGAVAGAGTNLANAQSNIFGSQANAAANAANQRASANAGMVGSLAGTAANLFSAWGGGAPAGGGGTNTGNWAQGNW